MSAIQKPAGTGVPSDRSPVPAAEDWRERAVCAGIGEFLFFPAKGHEQLISRARDVCRTCPVAAPCLEFALEMEAQWGFLGRHGVWGATSPKEREVIARARKRAAA